MSARYLVSNALRGSQKASPLAKVAAPRSSGLALPRSLATAAARSVSVIFGCRDKRRLIEELAQCMALFTLSVWEGRTGGFIGIEKESTFSGGALTN